MFFDLVQIFVASCTVAHQAPLSMEFSRQEHQSKLPFPTPGDLPDPGVEPMTLASPALAGRFFTTSATWESLFIFFKLEYNCFTMLCQCLLYNKVNQLYVYIHLLPLGSSPTPQETSQGTQHHSLFWSPELYSLAVSPVWACCRAKGIPGLVLVLWWKSPCSRAGCGFWGVPGWCQPSGEWDQFLGGWLQGLWGSLGWCWPSGRRGQVSERLVAWPGDFRTGLAL